MPDRRMQISEVVDLVAGIFARRGATPLQARATARALTLAEADGQSGHGLSRVESYAAQLVSGKVRGDAVPEIIVAASSVLRIDANLGFAYPALDLATEQILEIVPRCGVALAAVNRSHHCGSLSLVVERLAEAGVVGLMLANTPSAMAPWGGRRGLLGTNPISCAFPRPGRDPVIIDMSLSVVARGKIVAAEQKGQSIPNSWALDSAGAATTDPGAALAGTMLPVGGAKGAALAIAVEALAAGLTGAHFASEASSFLDEQGMPPATGQLLIGIDPGASGGPSAVAHLGRLFEMIEAEDGARLPGARKGEARRYAMIEGIDVPEAVLGLAER